MREERSAARVWNRLESFWPVVHVDAVLGDDECIWEVPEPRESRGIDLPIQGALARRVDAEQKRGVVVVRITLVVQSRRSWQPLSVAFA
jgi:hypothetical protein